MNNQDQNQDTATEDTVVLPDIAVPGEEEITAEVETEETGEATKEEEENSSEDGAEEDTEEKPKKESSFARRRRRDKERIQALEDENRRLKQPAQTQQQTATKSDEPKPDDFEHGINDINYINARAEWVGREAATRTFYELKQADLKETQQQKFQRELADAHANFEEKIDAAFDKYDDFEEVYSRKIDLDPAVLHALKKSPVAGDLAYHILKDRKLSAEISQMNAIDGIAKIGELNAKLTPVQKKDKNGVSKMTKPFKPVGTGKTNSRPEFSEDMSQEAFNERYPIENY